MIESVPTSSFSTSLSPRGETLDAELVESIGEAAASEWLVAHAIHSPEIVRTHDNAGLAAALLVTHRPYTAYRKIAKVWSRDDAALDAAVERLISQAREAGGVAAVKWEDALAEQGTHASRNGFSEMVPPITSGAGTSQRAGYVLWLEGQPQRNVPYYRQTTEYSCGPVALLMAQSAETGSEITRSEEMRLWRMSSHQPGAGPIALAVYADLDTYRPEVFISTEDVILGEHLVKPWELEVRALFDGEDERTAGELGIPITYRLFTLDELASEIDAGGAALLLIDVIYFHNETGSHWILAHSHSDGVFLVNDPWIDAENGDSWVDASHLPVAQEDLEKIVWWGDPAFRGLVMLRPTVAARRA